MRSATIAILACLLLLSVPTTIQAQAPTATLTVTVVDSTGAVLPGAKVTVEGLEAGNKGVFVDPVQTSPVIFNGTDATVRSIDQGQRSRLQFFVQANNLTNRYNYIGYSGTLTSPFYGQPTAVTGTRRIETGFNFGF